MGDKRANNQNFENFETLLSIGEFSEISRASIKSLRYYERVGALIPAYVNPETGHRYYTISQLQQLNPIRACVEEGLPIKDLHEYYNNADVLEIEQFFNHCSEAAHDRMRKAYATMVKMDAYKRAYKQQITAHVLSTRLCSFEEELLLITPLCERIEEASVLEYSKRLSACVRVAQDRGIISLADQGMWHQPGTGWYVYLEVFPEEGVAEKLPDDSEFSLQRAPQGVYRVKSVLRAQNGRSFSDACQLAARENAVRIQEGWAYAFATDIFEYDCLMLPRRGEGEEVAHE